MERNKFGFIIFGIFVLALVVGGYVLMKKSEEQPSKNETFIKELSKEENKEIRIDETKDYIYFTDSKREVDELDIDYRTINFNFKGAEAINKKLNEENEKLKETLEYDEDLEDEAYNKLSYAKYSIYTVYMYDKYISLVVDYYEFDREEIVSYIDTDTYVFNKNTGNIITNDDLLKEFNLNEDDVLDKVKDYVEDQDVLKDEEKLDSEETIKNIDELALYVDKIGRLSVSILVKSDQKDYNDSVILS